MTSIQPTIPYAESPFIVLSSQVLNSWFADTVHPERFCQRVLSPEWSELSKDDKEFVLTHASRYGVYESAAEKNNVAFFQRVSEFPHLFHEVDNQGSSVITYVSSPQLFSFLLDCGAPYVSPKSNILNAITSFYLFGHGYQNHEKKEDWIPILKRVFLFADIRDFADLNRMCIYHLYRLAQSDVDLQSILLAKLEEANKTAPDVIVRIGKNILDHDGKDFLTLGISLSCQGKISGVVIEEVLCSPSVILWHLKNPELDLLAQNSSVFTEPFQLLLTKTDGCLRSAICLRALQKAQNMEEAADILKGYSEFLENRSSAPLSQEVRQEFIDAVLRLQQQENKTIWEALPDYFGYKKLILLHEFGFDLNWENPITKRTIVFTNIYLDPSVNQLINPAHLDYRGENALEVYCKEAASRNDISKYRIVNLIKLGITLGNSFPYKEICQEVFPDNTTLQVILAAFLLNPNRAFIESTIHHWSLKIDHALLSHPFTAEKLGPLLKVSKEDHPYETWMRYYTDKSKELLQPLVDPNRSHWRYEYLLYVLGSVWEDPVPLRAVQTIPEKPLLSLLIETLREQGRRGLMKPNLFKLIRYNFNRNETILFNQYLFQNPDLMKWVVQRYFRVERLEISRGGGARTTFAQSVSEVYTNLKDDSWRKTFKWVVQSLSAAFHKQVSPVPLESLTIPPGASTRWVGRTFVIKTAAGTEAWKFLKEGESLSAFASEYAVTSAFFAHQEMFQSTFHKPLGLHIVRHLPPALQIREPAIVYRYEPPKGIFKYPENLNEEDFRRARNIFLADAGKMCRNHVYPDVISLFHNNIQAREYIAMVDLAAALDESELKLYRALGAGRCEKALEAARFSNFRKTGLTDLADARHPYSGNTGDLKRFRLNGSKEMFFKNVNGLSRVIIADMLILALRYNQQNALDWENEAFMAKFAAELSEGFSELSASFTEKTLEEWTAFVENGGINWTRMAKQIAFWVSDSHIPWVEKERVPEGLYEPEVQIVINRSTMVNFGPGIGFNTDGQRDIGTFNGPLMLTEFEKAMYVILPVAVNQLESIEPPARTNSTFRRNYPGFSPEFMF